MMYNFETTLGNINVVVEGTPIVLENITVKFSAEISVQEMATGGSFIKDLVKEVKDAIKEASAPREIIKKEEEPELPTGKFTGGEPIEAKPNYKLNLKGAFEVLDSKLIQTEVWASDGYGNIHWKSNTDNLKEIQISLDKRCIDMHFYHFTKDPVHIHVYEDRVRYSGIAGVYAERFFKNLGVPGAEEIYKLVNKVKEAD